MEGDGWPLGRTRTCESYVRVRVSASVNVGPRGLGRQPWSRPPPLSNPRGQLCHYDARMAATRKDDLEGQLTALTREFVGKLVHAIRNASFAEVAALPGPRAAASAPRVASAAPTRTSASQAGRAGAPGRQTAARRA